MTMTSREPNNFLENTALVVAHPDDEVLWFSSVLDNVNAVIICFSDLPGSHSSLGRARRAAIANHPADNVKGLELTESGTFLAVDWRSPKRGAYGLKIPWYMRGLKARYQANFAQLCERLRVELQHCDHVITHNPWGEYGHEEHVQVHRAVASLRAELHFRVWFSNYASDRASSLLAEYAATHDGDDYLTLPTNIPLALEAKKRYEALQCWTWDADYQWADDECFMCLAEGGQPTGYLFPIHTVKVPFAWHIPKRVRLRGWWSRQWRGLQRRLRLPMPEPKRRYTYDRTVLEQVILPCLTQSYPTPRTLFVGCASYTKFYDRWFNPKNRFWTMDSDPSLAKFGAKYHVVDRLEHAENHYDRTFFDVIICNGVYGWGLDRREHIEKAIQNCFDLLRPHGILVLGWNNLPEYTPVPLAEIEALHQFERYEFPPLRTWRYPCEGYLRHVFDFYRKP